MNCPEKQIISLLITFLVGNTSIGQISSTNVSKRESRFIISTAKKDRHSEEYVSAYSYYLKGKFVEAIDLLTPCDSTNNDQLVLLTSCYLAIENNDAVHILMKHYLMNNKPVENEVKSGNELFKFTSYPEEYDVVTRNLAIHFFWNYEEDSALYYINESMKVVNDPENFWFRGIIQADLGHSDLACLDYYTAIHLGYDSAQAYYDKGNCNSWKETWLPLAFSKSEEISSYQSPDERALRKTDGQLVVGKRYSLNIDGKKNNVVLNKLYQKDFGHLLVFLDDAEQVFDIWLPFYQNKLNWELRYND